MGKKQPETYNHSNISAVIPANNGTQLEVTEKFDHIQHDLTSSTTKEPDLQGTPDMGGINPARHIPDWNLAGSDGTATPQDLTRSAPGEMHRPDFDLPDFSQAVIQTYDLTTPGIDYTAGQNRLSDPALPDLDDYEHPYGLTIYHPEAKSKADTSKENAEKITGNESLTILHDPLSYDPTLPQELPRLHPDIKMQQRPGELAPEALQQIHHSPYYQQMENIPYNEVFMDQSSLNTSRRRHLDLLLNGLDQIGS